MSAAPESAGLPWLRWAKRVAALGLGVAVVSVGGVWLLLRASLPRLDGRLHLDGLESPVKVERDALGVPSIHAASRLDAARALGFLHAQERFFQMDLLRRMPAGELAEIVGPAALASDRDARRHRFRSRAEAVVRDMPAAARARLAAYAAGVNGGLAALGARPWEYHVLRADPAPWREADTMLVFYAMWLDLQDEEGRYERTIRALRSTVDDGTFRALAPVGDWHDAPLDGSSPPPVALPPPLRSSGAMPVPPLEEPVVGSNAFAVAGRHALGGAALVASDMHLSLAVPNIWYRAALYYEDGYGRELRLVGVTLPGVPDLVAGSNGRVAWAFTNSYIDTLDLVPVETDAAGERYRTPEGWTPFEVFTESVPVKGQAAATASSRWTRWGPLIEEPRDGRALAAAWNAHDATAINLELGAMHDARDIDEAMAVAQRAGMPNQNLIVADATGRIAWTLAGRIPVRVDGFDGIQAGNWAGGAAGWAGWLAPELVPRVVDPAPGVLWSANQRHVGGEALRRLGDNGYDQGYRAGAIRDDLMGLVGRDARVTPRDLLAIQLDDHVPHLLPWRDVLVATLETSSDPLEREVREVVRPWDGRAVPDSAAHRLVRAFREATTERVLAPYLQAARSAYPRFNSGKLHTDELTLRLVRERPEGRLDRRYASWEALTREAAQTVVGDVRASGRPAREYVWGGVNRLAMRHPLSQFLPRMVRAWIDMPAVALPGDAESPRHQTPRHGASERMVVAPGREEEGLFHMPGGQSGHPLSPYYKNGHEAWARGEPTPLLPGRAVHVLELAPE